MLCILIHILAWQERSYDRAVLLGDCFEASTLSVMKQMPVIPCVLLMLTITAHQHVLVYDDRSDHATVTLTRHKRLQQLSVCLSGKIGHSHWN